MSVLGAVRDPIAVADAGGPGAVPFAGALGAGEASGADGLAGAGHGI